MTASKRLTSQQAIDIYKRVQDQEIKQALSSIGDNKKPKPNGFSSIFFKATWDVIREDIMAAINKFLYTSQLPKQSNHTMLTLIPNNLRKESGGIQTHIMCNVSYKVIYKILPGHIAHILNDIIDLAQTTFISGRNITTSFT